MEEQIEKTEVEPEKKRRTFIVIREQLLDLLKSRPMGLNELSHLSGLSHISARRHVNYLIAIGQVRLANFSMKKVGKDGKLSDSWIARYTLAKEGA